MIELTESEEEQLFLEITHLLWKTLPMDPEFTKRYPTLYKVHRQLYSTKRKPKRYGGFHQMNETNRKAGGFRCHEEERPS